MKLFNLATSFAVLNAIQAKVLVVTETTVHTVVAGAEPSSSSSLESSSSWESSSTFNSSSIEPSSTWSSSSVYVAPTTSTSTTPTSTYVAPTTTSSSTTPTSTYVAPTTTSSSSSSSSKTSPTTFVTKSSSSKSASEPTSGSDDSGSDSDAPSDFAKSILDAHNQKRADHKASPLTWDSKLADYASNYASKYSCSGSLTHSGGPYGENLAVGYSDGVKALDAWYDEGKNYDYSSASKFDHFTQVVWKDTTKLGCAEKDCSSQGWGKYVICSYDPAGNMIGSGKSNVLQ